MFDRFINEIEEKIGYHFSDISLLRQAFTRTSYCNERGFRLQSNEVLEFLGDSVLSTAIITRLLTDKGERYKHGLKTEIDEGGFSVIKSNLSDKHNLSKSMMRLGLQKYLIMGEGDTKLGIENEPSVMEDLFESIIGAVYIDCGMNMQTVMGTVSRMLDITEYLSGSAADKNAKGALQEWCQDKSRRLPQPTYETVEERGPEHKKTYIRACKIDGKTYGTGEGKNLKIADAIAAEEALENLKKQAK